MGVWGSGSFDNDAALDLVNRLIDEQSIAPAQQVLARGAAMAPADFIFDGELAEAVAAAEVVAAVRGFPAARLPAGLAEWRCSEPVSVTAADWEHALAVVALARTLQERALAWHAEPARLAHYFQDNAAYWAANGEHYEPTLDGLHASFAPYRRALADLEQRLLSGRGRLRPEA